MTLFHDSGDPHGVRRGVVPRVTRCEWLFHAAWATLFIMVLLPVFARMGRFSRKLVVFIFS